MLLRSLAYILASAILLLQFACRQDRSKATELKERFSQELQTGGRSNTNETSSEGEALFVEKSCDMCHTRGEATDGKISLQGLTVAELVQAKDKEAHKPIANSWPTPSELLSIQASL